MSIFHGNFTLRLGVAGKRFARGLDIQVLAKAATGHRAEPLFDQF